MPTIAEIDAKILKAQAERDEAVSRLRDLHAERDAQVAAADAERLLGTLSPDQVRAVIKLGSLRADAALGGETASK